jgi:hypothetical protein
MANNYSFKSFYRALKLLYNERYLVSVWTII